MRVKIDKEGAQTIDENGKVRYYDWVEIPPLKAKGNNLKDKWINIRCTEPQRKDVTELAKERDMKVSELFWHLVAKERKEREK